MRQMNVCKKNLQIFCTNMVILNWSHKKSCQRSYFYIFKGDQLVAKLLQSTISEVGKTHRDTSALLVTISCDSPALKIESRMSSVKYRFEIHFNNQSNLWWKKKKCVMHLHYQYLRLSSCRRSTIASGGSSNQTISTSMEGPIRRILYAILS